MTAPDIVTGTVALSPARVRAVPDTEGEIVARLPEGAQLLLGGLSEDGAWVLIKVIDERLEEDGLEGWMSLQLIELFGDPVTLPLFDLEGLPLPPSDEETSTPEASEEPPADEATQEATAEPAEEATAESVATPEPEGETPATATPTPLQEISPLPTPTVEEETSPLPTPTAEEEIPARPLPAPEEDELVLTVLGQSIPANPLDPIVAVSDDGSEYLLNFDLSRSDQVEIWSGALGEADDRWLSARPELLWPGTRIYVRGQANADDENVIDVERARIVAPPPDWNRLRLFTVPRYATAIARDEALTLLSVSDDPGIWLLETDDDFTRIWDSGQGIVAIEGENGGAVIPSSNINAGISSFVYLRNDGLMVEVTAQPFYSLAGVAGDGVGDLWWIEVSQVAPETWQLWYYDSAQGRLSLAAQLPLSLFENSAQVLLQPRLIDVRMTDSGLSMLVETADQVNRQLNTGLFRVVLTEDGVGEVARLLEAGSYRGPLRVNPSGTRLAYFVYDPELESLTEGFVQPPNRLFLLALDASEEATPVQLYETETRFEFLAPNLSWRNDDELILARSRFSPEGVFALERFGIVSIQIAEDGSVSNTSYLLPAGTLMQDFAVCQDSSVMLSITGESVAEIVDTAPTDSESTDTERYGHGACRRAANHRRGSAGTSDGSAIDVGGVAGGSSAATLCTLAAGCDPYSRLLARSHGSRARRRGVVFTVHGAVVILRRLV